MKPRQQIRPNIAVGVLLALLACFLPVPALGKSPEKARLASGGLPERLFPRGAQLPACLSLAPKNLGKDQFTHVDPSLNAAITGISDSLRELKATSLLPYFHPRLRTPLAALKKSLTQQEFSLGAPLEVSVYRLFAIATKDGRADSIPCPDDKLVVYPHYGYDLQFALWLQLLGKKELGRIFLTLVLEPKEQRWQIGFFHFHKWTHAEKTYEHWLREAQQDYQKGQWPLSAFKADIADKLVLGSEHFQFTFRREILEFKEKIRASYDWQAELRKILAPKDVLSLSTLYVDGGIGLLVRTQIPEELSSNAIREDCQNIKATLAATAWFANLKGVRCSYVIKGEDPSKEGRLGSLFIAQP